MAKIAWGLVIVLAISLGIAIYTERRPEAPPEEAVRPGLERAEEIIEEDEKIKVLPEEAIWPGLEVRFEGRTLQEWKQELDSPSIERRRAAVRTLGEFGIVGILLLFKALEGADPFADPFFGMEIEEAINRGFQLISFGDIKVSPDEVRVTQMKPGQQPTKDTKSFSEDSRIREDEWEGLGPCQVTLNLLW